MSISLNRTPGPAFGATKLPKISKERKKELSLLVDHFNISDQKRFSGKFRNDFGRIFHFSNELVQIGCTIQNIIEKDFAGAIGTASFMCLWHGLDKMFHNLALRKSKILLKKLRKDGIKNEKELGHAVNLYLKKTGGIIHSNLFCLTSQKKIDNLVKTGELPKLNGIVYKFQMKYDITKLLKRKFLRKKAG